MKGRKGREKRKEGGKKRRKERGRKGMRGERRKKRGRKGRRWEGRKGRREGEKRGEAINWGRTVNDTFSISSLHSISQAAWSQKRDSAHQRSLRTADKQLTKFLQAKILEQMTGQKR